jgi:hypothetical protein
MDGRRFDTSAPEPPPSEHERTGQEHQDGSCDQRKTPVSILRKATGTRLHASYRSGCVVAGTGAVIAFVLPAATGLNAASGRAIVAVLAAATGLNAASGRAVVIILAAATSLNAAGGRVVVAIVAVVIAAATGLNAAGWCAIVVVIAIVLSEGGRRRHGEHKHGKHERELEQQRLDPDLHQQSPFRNGTRTRAARTYTTIMRVLRCLRSVRDLVTVEARGEDAGVHGSWPPRAAVHVVVS